MGVFLGNLYIHLPPARIFLRAMTYFKRRRDFPFDDVNWSVRWLVVDTALLAKSTAAAKDDLANGQTIEQGSPPNAEDRSEHDAGYEPASVALNLAEQLMPRAPEKI
jgi:hypothetical protein